MRVTLPALRGRSHEQQDGDSEKDDRREYAARQEQPYVLFIRAGLRHLRWLSDYPDIDSLIHT